MKIKTYRDLDIWKRGMELVKDVYAMTENFPSHETYNLVSQMRRSTISVPSNAAEGFRTRHNKEYRQFLYTILGSRAELETQITLSKELRYITEGLEETLLGKTDHICRMVSNLIKKL